MQSGKLRHRVSLLIPTYTQNQNTGEMTASWSDSTKLWASIEPLSGREFIAAQTAQSKVNARIKIRYRSDISYTMRIMDGAAVYNIEAVLPDKESGKEYLTIMASTLEDGETMTIDQNNYVVHNGILIVSNGG